ncbi:NifU family protein [Paracrocinitomix mangrovi]|uniref:NifU family protein n=1 Tax=Paracrocinitomix mangrovi TaxID=2862509 RepID=UPI001C8D04A7|nr:NifU family protein [Paracrocinitomix mangrovi]UKN00611.1 NifU family protein [Paracrocinitomix mangrovi]
MEEKRVPVTMYAEMTPNPLTMKFVANKHLLMDDASVEFGSMQEAKGYSPLAEALFEFPFVDNVFIAGNFVTVTKTDNVDWDFIVMELREFIKEWIAQGKDILVMMPQGGGSKEEAVAVKKEFAPSEFDEVIIGLLNEYVKPAVENDGGAIDYVGFEDGVVTVEMKGSCSGCPSSTATLKGGIEQLLKSSIQEVKEVVALSV